MQNLWQPKTKEDVIFIKGYKKLSIMFLIGLAVVMAVPGSVSASSATGVHTTSSTVSAHGWNSCSSGWFKTGGTFINYCPFCHRYGTLTYNPKGTYEGEWTCMHCDADFCNCGRCKAVGSHVYLVKV